MLDIFSTSSAGALVRCRAARLPPEMRLSTSPASAARSTAPMSISPACRRRQEKHAASVRRSRSADRNQKTDRSPNRWRKTFPVQLPVRPRRRADGNGAAPSGRKDVLSVHSVGKSFVGRQVVKGVSLYVRKGEAVGLLGPNGAGKTTVFYMITGLIKADNGRIELDGYPKCKYIKQNLIEGMKCPKCGTGDLAERKARRGNIFWGCTNYPKCDFTSNLKPVAEKCPECGSAYLVEKTLKSGIYLECPNKKRGAEEEAAPAKKGRGKKAAAAPAAHPHGHAVCHYSKRIGDAPPPPTAETHGPVPEKQEKKRELQPA